MLEIDPDRLMADLRELAQFGKVSTGVNRTAFSGPDTDARLWLAGRMDEAGLTVTTDSVGNVYGRSPLDGPAVLIGSHSDSVPTGGWLDGAMGVIYGLEIARAAAEAGGDSGLSVDVISFQDEEGTFFPCLGSRSFCGEIAQDDLTDVKSRDGRSLLPEIARQPYHGAAAAALEGTRYRAYLEAHIEQGPRMEAESKRVGIVTDIVGIRRFQITADGRADHAGTTPMSMRRDASATAIRFGAELLSLFETAAGPNTVWNIGTIEIEPGAANVVPSKAILTFEFRETSGAALDALEQETLALADRYSGAGPVPIRCDKTADISPAKMDEGIGEAIEGAAADLAIPSMRLPSGGGHDAMVMARHIPSAMLFVPSIGGRSHDYAEDTAEADIVDGCRVLAATVDRMAKN